MTDLLTPDFIKRRFSRRTVRRFWVAFWSFAASYAVFDASEGAPTILRADPFSGAVLTSLLISAAITAGTTAVEFIIASRRKVPPVDRGRFDDIRVQGNEYGAFVPRVYGKARLAGFLIDATPITHSTRTTPGRSGGKGAPKPPTAPETHHVYTTTLAVGVCEGLGALAPDLKINRIWETLDVIYDRTGDANGDHFVEAEDATLAGGAAVVIDADASGGEAVTIPPGGSVQWTAAGVATSTGRVSWIYKSSADIPVQLTVGASVWSDTFITESGAYRLYQTADIALTSSTLIKVRNDHATQSITLDRIAANFSGRQTGVIDPLAAPPRDQDDQRPFFRYTPEVDADGVTSGALIAGGHAGFRLYTGTETQTADSALVALHGAANTPAYRGLVYVVFDSYTLKDPFLPNFTFEVDTGVTALDDIVADLYSLVGISSSDIDVTALASDSFDADEGFVVSSREQAARWIEDLQTRFQFDCPEVDGKVKAVKRDGTSAFTITADELRGHWDGEEAPEYEVLIADVDEMALPRQLEVGYMDEANDYHNNVQQAMRLSGNSRDIQTVNIPMVMRATNARRLAETILYQRHMESRVFSIKTGPKYQKLHPGDVGTIQLANASHVVRVAEHKWQLMGVQEFEMVRAQPSVYSQTITGVPGSGYEAPTVRFPGNTKGVFMDGPIFRPEDAGDGRQPVVYVVPTMRGVGEFQGAFLYKERPVGSGSYKEETNFEVEGTVGTVTGSVGAIDYTVWDRATTLTLDFWRATSLESVTEAQAVLNPELNLFVIVDATGTLVYAGQFTTVAAGSATLPYVSRYTVSGVRWGRFGTRSPAGEDLTGYDFVLLNSAVKPRRIELHEIGQPRNYKFVTSGQGVDEAPVTVFTAAGNSLKPLAPVHVRALLEDSFGTRRFVEFERQTRIGASLRDHAGAPIAEEAARFAMEVYTDDGLTRKRTLETTSLSLTTCPIFWELTGQSAVVDPVFGGDGNIAYQTTGMNNAGARSKQTFANEATLSFVVKEDPSAPGTPLPLPERIGFSAATLAYAGGETFFAGRGSAGDKLQAESDATTEQTIRPGDVVTIRMRGGVVEYLLNSNSTPFRVSNRTVTPDVKYRVTSYDSNVPAAPGSIALRVSITSRTLGFYYDINHVIEDFGTTNKPTIYVRLYQLSAVIGPGEPFEGVI